MTEYLGLHFAISMMPSLEICVSLLQGGSASNLNMNLYATKKTAAEGMLDIALFLANITHMKTVIEQGAGYRYNICTYEEGKTVIVYL